MTLVRFAHIMPPVTVIINASSGIGAKDDLRQRLNDAFEASSLEVNIFLAHSGAEVTELARGAAHSPSEVVVAGGGDGTINAVATAIIDHDKTLGVVPLGTLNHFAKDLNIPLDLEAAAQTIVAGHSIKVDVGEVNGRVFLNNSSLGLYPQIVREREKQKRFGYRKWPAFAWAALTVLRRYPFLDVRLQVAGKEFQRRTPFVFVGNNQYVMESFSIGIRERLNEGQLSLYITNRTGRLGLARLALRALLGRLREEKDFLALNAHEVWIATRHKKLRVAFDGEVELLVTPLHYRVRPRALRVIVPAPDSQPG
jgi:YegS/Rv2252/BmrU family lipid kinase